MERWDVIIIGAGLGGMLTGALLARRGRRVLVLERGAQPGGRLRSYDVDGFVVDCGAFLWPNKFLGQALARAGVNDFVASEIPADQVMRICIQGLEGRRFTFPWLGGDSADIEDTVREVYRLTPDEFRRLTGVLAQLAQTDANRLEALLPVTVRDWSATHIGEARIADALLRTLMLFGTYDAGSASIGEFARTLQRKRGAGPPAKPEYCGANPRGGVRALVDAIGAALKRNGATLRLNSTVAQIVVEHGRAVDVMVHGRLPFHERLTADAIVSNLPIWTLFDILAERHFPTEFVANARHYAKVGGSVDVAYAFRELPVLRQTGEPDRFPGWTRLLVGAERSFGGGLFWMSHHSPHNAPPGQHLLQGMRLVPQSTVTDHAAVDRIVADFDGMVRELYRNVDDTLLWRRSWVTRDGTEYMISAVPRPNVQAPSIERLYFVGETINLPSIQMDNAAHSALECARLIEST